MPQVVRSTVTSFTSVFNNDAVLVDGADGTRPAAKGQNFWSSAFRPEFPDHRLYPAWVVVDLGRHRRLEAIRLHPRILNGAAVGWPVDFTILVCAEGESWRTVAAQTDAPVPSPAAQTFPIPPVLARFIKVEATRLRQVEPGRPTHHVQLAEIEAVGAEADPGPLLPIPIPTASPLLPGGLRCDDRCDPLGVDPTAPIFSWHLDGGGRGERQTAWRILVASSLAILAADRGDLWDSGRVASGNPAAIAYGGVALPDGARCHWKVQAWDAAGHPTAWSPPASFVTGLRAGAWRGRWIGTSEDPGHAAVHLRRAFTVEAPLRKATLFWSGLGWSEVSINGRQVGDAVLSPGPTSYHIRTPYQVADVTALLQEQGAATIGVLLADGWYNLAKDPWVHRFEKLPYVDRPKLRLDLVLEYADGRTATVASDGAWRWSPGPITRAWIAEEDHDLRRAMPGWDKPGFDDRAWKTVAEVTPPAGRLVPQREPPTRILAEHHPQRIVAAGANTWTVEFGHEFQGWVRVAASAPAATVVTITTRPKGYVSRWTLVGTGIEEYSPRFHYNAVSAVTIQGLPRAPTLDEVVGCQVGTDLATTGAVRTSDPMLDWLHDCAVRTFINYNTGMPNDPTREKKGWSQDFQTQMRPMSYQFDLRAFFSRWHADVIDGQAKDGNLPNIAPGPFYDDFNSTWWGGMGVWAAWQFYQIHGDPRLLTGNHAALVRYLDFLAKPGKRLPRTGWKQPSPELDRLTASGAARHVQDWGLPDWLAIEDTHPALVNTTAYAHYARILAASARLQGRADEVGRWAGLADQIMASFNACFLDAKCGVYNLADAQPIAGVGGAAGNSKLAHQVWWQPGERVPTQGAQALALGLGLVPEAQKAKAEAVLLREIQAHDGHLSTGFVSSQYLLEVLADLSPEVGQTIVSKRTMPSWYAMSVGSGSDIMRETWGGGAAMMPPLGSGICFWNWHALAGIRPDPAGPGFAKIIIRPCVVGTLHRVEAHYESAHGRIGVLWRRRAGTLALDVDLPANTEATVYIPTRDTGNVRAGGRPLTDDPGIRVLPSVPHYAVVSVTSGAYRFTSDL